MDYIYQHCLEHFKLMRYSSACRTCEPPKTIGTSEEKNMENKGNWCSQCRNYTCPMANLSFIKNNDDDSTLSSPEDKTVNDNTLTQEIVTSAAYYVVNGVTYYNKADALSALDTYEGTPVSFYASPERKETQTLYPLAQSGWTKDDEPNLYLHVEPLRKRNKIRAIKTLREMTDMGLKDAKDAIEGKEIIELPLMTVGVARVLDTLLRETYQIQVGPNRDSASSMPPMIYAEKC